MLSRPRNPGHRRASPTSPKLWLAVAILLVPWVSLADAKQPFEAAAHPPQQQGQERLGHHDHGDQRINNHGSQPVPDGGLVQNLAVTNIRDADLGNETPLMHIKDRQGRPDAEYPSRRQQTPLKQQHAARSSFSNSHNKRSDPARQYKEKPLKNSYNNKISNHNYNNDHILIPDDASALATLAPAQNKQPVRAPHPPRHVRSGSSPASSAGLVPPQVARSLEDWEVEDFVLLATVDGDLYANDRKTLKERWHLEVDQPMVETKHYRTNTSLLDGDFSPIDHYIWAVEPTRDGSVFVWMPNTDAGLIRTGFTMKQLVEELAPFADEEPPVVYTGDKKTTLITLDAATGKVLKWFGSGGSHVNNEESCSRPNSPLYDRDMDECSSTGTITLGRTEYTVSIQRKDGPAIATLKYSEWGPNNFDTDLLHQYQASMDNRYFASHSDGNVYAFDPHLQRKPSTHEKFATPVARVFDVCRPWDAPSDSNPELVVLPQPPMPPRDVEVARSRSRSIFLNQTETGSWYVMSGRSYPLILDAPVAEITHPSWSGHSSLIEAIDPRVVVKALIGTHHVDSPRASDEHEFPSLPASSDDHDKMLPVLVNEDGYDPSVLDKLKSLPQSVVNSIVDLVSNPVLIIMLIVALFMNEHKLRRSYHNFKEKGVLRDSSAWQFWKTPSDNDSVAGTDIADHASDKAQEKESTRVTEEDSSMEPQVDDKLKEPTAVQPGSENVQPREGRKQPGKAAADEVPAGDSQQNGHASPKDDALEHVDGGQQDDQPQKKKARRGRRGGVKHRKGSKAPDLAKSESGDKDGPLDDAVTNAKKLADRQDNARSLQPNSLLATNHQELNGPLLKVGDIIVNTAEQLGSGSNGTLVFAGKFDGRDVAVKRMLGSFYFIADQETKLLRETDDHPNVIRYYARVDRDEFLYVALERCAASLADVIEKPQSYRELAIAGRKDLPAVLYQITNGMNHLHSLRIVHRDLKPQNILISMGKDGKPRLVVSDFGLCKKLEGGQSSFGATTGRAAGTTGWRAPELLLDDDRQVNGIMDTDTHSGSGSVLVPDGISPNGKRATRAIDIFSLGLVFYYVLSNGFHPFDCGDKYMREVNIRKGNFNLDHLDSLGDWSVEAKDLIASMLDQDPKRRPSAHEILGHPFFWSPKKRLAFLCDVSDHFEKEPRDPPSAALEHLESFASQVVRGDFLKNLPREFVDSLGKQRKYSGNKLLDLLRALRNKRNHYEDMPESLQRQVGSLPVGYLSFWTTRFSNLLLTCWNVVYNMRWEDTDRFREYYEPAGLS